MGAGEKSAARLDSQVLPLKAEVNELRVELHDAQRSRWHKLTHRG